MITEQTQVKVNLPGPLKEYLESKANKFDLPISGYIRHLILKDVGEMDYPIYQASKPTEEAFEKAKEAEKSGKLVSVTNVDGFFSQL